MNALSRQHFFSHIGVGLDPGNVVLSCMLWVCICRSGACVHFVDKEHMDGQCASCKTLPKLTEILRNHSQATKMSQARLLLLCMQKRFSSLRFNGTCNCEIAGDVVEATGGILSPWRHSAEVVVRHLADLFRLTSDDVDETVEAMGGLARECSNFYRKIYRSELNEAEQVPGVFATFSTTYRQQSLLVEERSVRSASLWPRCLRHRPQAE